MALAVPLSRFPPRVRGGSASVFVRRHTMRVLLIIITLIGGASFGYSLVGRDHYLASHSDFVDAMHTTQRWRVSQEQFEALSSMLEVQEMAQQRDWQVVRYLGAATFLLGVSALILERRRYVPRNAA